MSFNSLCLCPLSLTAKLNLNIIENSLIVLGWSTASDTSCYINHVPVKTLLKLVDFKTTVQSFQKL